MLKKLIGKQLPPMLAMLNTIFQHEATQATCKQPVELDANGLPIPFILTRHQYKASMIASKETSDDAEMIALVKKAREEDLIDQQRRTKNDNDQATLKIKILLKNSAF